MQSYQYWLRLMTTALIGLAVGTIGAVGGFGLLATVRYTNALTHPGCERAGFMPHDVDIQNAEHITYWSHDGLRLGAWYVPPQNGALIILLPGLGGAREGMLSEGAILAQHGFGLFLTDLRSCSHPDGETTLGALEAADLEEAVSWVRGQPDVDHVGVLGYSLGGVAAILGAAVDQRIDAVVAEGGFYDLAADITNRGGKNPPWESLIHRMVLFQFRRETGIAAREISPISVIDRISPRPLLLIYGEREAADTHPHEQLARANEPKSLWIVPNCGHGGYLRVAPKEWERRVTGFFRQALTAVSTLERSNLPTQEEAPCPKRPKLPPRSSPALTPTPHWR